jgi:GGDEF domain-containing protein
MLKRLHHETDRNELTEAWALLLRGMASEAVVGDKADIDEFQLKIESLAHTFSKSPGNAKEIALTAIQGLRRYQQQALRTSSRSQSLDMQEIVSELTKAMSSVSDLSERSISRLESIQKLLDTTLSLDDLHTVRARFAEYLDTARQEMLQQGADLSEMVSGVIGEFKRIQERAKKATVSSDEPLIRANDSVTGLPGRGYAEAILTEAYSQPTQSFVGIFVIERMELITARFGFAAADQMLLHFSQHLAQNLTNAHNLFRWGPASFLSFVVSSCALEELRREIQKVALRRIDKVIEIGERTVLLPISCQYSLLPVAKNRAPEQLFHDVEAFVHSVSRGSGGSAA